jgi:hypothetical protein
MGDWVKSGGVGAVVISAIAVLAGVADAHTSGGLERTGAIDRTEEALLDQIKCQRTPK